MQMQKVYSQLHAWFCTYGTPKEQSSDGGPPFQSQEYVQFLSNWGIHRCLSSAYYAQIDGRAEVAVKTAKRILLDNTDSAGCLDYDQTARTFLMHRNTPIHDLGLSPAMMLFGHSSKDHLPTLWQNTSVQPQWKEVCAMREHAMAKRYINSAEYYNTNSRTLTPLVVGDAVLIQNQAGNHPNRLEKTGRVVEVLKDRL